MNYSATHKVPVILDTDIGSDIDDTWAIGMMLKSPEIDFKLALSATNDTVYRAKIIARMFELAGRSDIAVGIGLKQNEKIEGQQGWVEGYDLEKYPTLRSDGVAAMIRIIMDSPVPVTVLSIGPLPNIARALEIEPRIAAKANFVGMFGSVFMGYNSVKDKRDKEYNVVLDIPACQKVFTAPWRSITITPLDSCGAIVLRDDLYQKVYTSNDLVAKIIIDNFKIWSTGRENRHDDHSTTVLFDTVAVYLTYSEENLIIKEMGLRITDDGYTQPDDTAPLVRVATGWKNGHEWFNRYLVDRLLSA